MFKTQPTWNLKRLKATFAEVQDSILKNHPPSEDTLKALSEVAAVPEALRQRAASESGRVTGHVLGVALRRGKVHWNALNALTQAVKADPAGAGIARDLVAYLQGVKAMNRALIAGDALAVAEVNLGPHRPALDAALSEVERAWPGARSLNILRAGLVSFDDRTAARDLYGAATEGGWETMATSIYDLGAHTYFSGPEVWARRRPIEETIPRADVAEAITARPAPYNRPWVTLLWSVDPGFLRIYGPQWFGLAPYLLNEGIGMAMVVTGPRPERQAAIAEARELTAGLARYRNLPEPERYADAISFIGVDVPDWIGETKTFYASARYLAAGPVLEATGAPVFVLDADQTVRDHMGPFLKKLLKFDVGMTRSRGLALLWPWRRNMAGAAFFNTTPGGQAMLARIRDYLTAGLAENPSWTLDQNALTFALEQAGDASVIDIGTAGRPLFQDTVRTVFEKTWREGPATPP